MLLYPLKGTTALEILHKIRLHAGQVQYNFLCLEQYGGSPSQDRSVKSSAYQDIFYFKVSVSFLGGGGGMVNIRNNR